MPLTDAEIAEMVIMELSRETKVRANDSSCHLLAVLYI